MALKFRKVMVGEFGNFRLSIRSKGTVTEDEFNAANITKARIVFTPGLSLRRSNSQVRFEEDDVKVVTGEGSGGGEEERPGEL